MASNKEKQGTYEAQCMESLRRSMFTKPYRDLGDMFGIRRAQCSGFIVDDSFRYNHYYGLFEPQSVKLLNPKPCPDDVYDFERLVATAVPQNNGKTEFPDFISSTGGFIEHFQVTAAADPKKGGAADKQDEAKQLREVDRRKTAIEQHVAETYDGTMQFHDSSFCSPLVDMSHEKFVWSFKKHWEDHIGSLHNSVYKEAYPRVFMVNACSNLLCMHERISPKEQWLDPQFYCGLLQYRRKYEGGYSLVRDIELLRYMQNFQDEIDFVIFMGSRDVLDIIKVESIKYMLPLLGCEFYIESAGGMNYHDVKCLTMPNIIQNHSESEDK